MFAGRKNIFFSSVTTGGVGVHEPVNNILPCSYKQPNKTHGSQEEREWWKLNWDKGGSAGKGGAQYEVNVKGY